MLISGLKRWTPSISSSIEQLPKPMNQNKPRSICNIASSSQKMSHFRRTILLGASVSLITTVASNCIPIPLISYAVEETKGKDKDDESLVGALKSLFETNEKTKLGKVLPKAYLKSARDVVKNLRNSVEEDPKDNAKFRRTADAAKESIREYLSIWRGDKTVVSEESYVEIEKAIRSLAGFYSKAGPSAPLPEIVKSEILNDLNAAEEFL